MSEEKQKRSSVSRERALEILAEVDAAGPGRLSREDKSGWIKVTNALSKGRVYIQNREDVREVHLSGWGAGFAGTVPPPKASGKVEAHLYMDGDDPLEALRAVLIALAAQEASAEVPKKERAPAAPRERAEPKKKASTDVDRVNRIRERARELGISAKLEVDGEGVPVDPEAFEAAVDEAAQPEA